MSSVKAPALLLVLALLASMWTIAFAAVVAVNVNGETVTFDQPPIERAGRVFVPLRGVFEKLGASVVYSNGQINAQGNGRRVSLHIGQRQALVNGQPIYSDVAPFIIGVRTMVPLRFVAQALGATVNYSQAQNAVYIVGSGAPAVSNNIPVNASFRLVNERPNVTANTLQPNIHAEFSEPIQRDSLRVAIDGHDVTNDVYGNSNGFDVQPRSALAIGKHTVAASGTTQAGARFNSNWSFAVQNGTTQNYIRNVKPTAGSRIGSNFTLNGMTLPGATLHIVASASANVVPGILGVGTGAFTADVQADANGRFSVAVNVNAISGGTIRVVITSKSSDGASVELPITYNS